MLVSKTNMTLDIARASKELYFAYMLNLKSQSKSYIFYIDVQWSCQLEQRNKERDFFFVSFLFLVLLQPFVYFFRIFKLWSPNHRQQNILGLAICGAFTKAFINRGFTDPLHSQHPAATGCGSILISLWCLFYIHDT